jgi:hypothetical protein
MGLDMYFTASRSLSNWVDDEKELKTKISKVTEDLFDWEVQEVRYQVGYWRKANAIHNWFVENVQDGEDDCKLYYVGEESIKELFDTVCQVLEDHSKAEELLPPQSGFFFGSTEINEDYFQDLEHTKEILEPIVQSFKEHEEGKSNTIHRYEFYYQSSW